MNHCVRILDSFVDAIEPDRYFIVMPFLCPYDDPPFGAAGEVVDFVRQTLEVRPVRIFELYTVIHMGHLLRDFASFIVRMLPIGNLSQVLRRGYTDSNTLITRDCTSENIMMDASALFPHGHHPVRRSATPDGIYVAHPLSRIDHPVKYYFIDFGISTRFELGEPTLVVGAKGRDKELPELSRDVKYNAMQADIFILGNMYKKDLLKVSADTSLCAARPLLMPVFTEISWPRLPRPSNFFHDLPYPFATPDRSQCAIAV